MMMIVRCVASSRVGQDTLLKKQVRWERVSGRQRAHQRLQFVERAQRVERDAVDRAPGHEALAVGRQRAQQRVGAVRDHQHLVVLEDVGDLRPCRSGSGGTPSRRRRSGRPGSSARSAPAAGH